MNGVRMLAIVLLVAGAFELGQGSFSHANASPAAEGGQSTLLVKETQTVNMAVWIGTGTMLLGSMLLLFVGLKHMRREARLRYY